ncbi:MAG: hypothetical protein Q7T82_20505 [Armatimonadota bacterium]|nr:hypothetical protein [Armatimonadota bacterium]
MIPPFQAYFPTLSVMDQSQKDFYGFWLRRWRQGVPVSVEGQISYVFCYIYCVLEQMNLASVLKELKRLSIAYASEKEPLPLYCQSLIADCHVMMGNFDKAVAASPSVAVSSRASVLADKLLSLKLRMGHPPSGKDLLALVGPAVTSWGRKHIAQVAEYLEILLQGYAGNERANLLELWASDSHSYIYQGFSGTPACREVPGVRCYSFSNNPKATEFAARLIRESENTCREEMDLPRVGEGWVAETDLYYRIRGAFAGVDVFHHARPSWLGRQHLDIWIPAFQVAVEYQGIQHDEPIEFFGGRDGYQRTRRRDAAKRRSCHRHGVRLICVRPGYDLSTVIDEIHSASPIVRDS